jgi:hypothetical protein
MEGKLQALKSMPITITEPADDKQGSVLEAVSELEERREKSKNILLMNIAESSATTRILKIKDDQEAVINIIKDFESVSVDNIKVSRIGREVADKTRPLKVTLGDSADAKYILRNNRLLKNGVKVKADLTISQREHLRNLWSEVDERRAAGEDNLTVKFFDSVPKIVKTSKNPAGQPARQLTTRTSEE